MRVIAGSARSRKLKTLEGEDVRPTVERVKEGLFSAIQFDIEGRRVLDLFGGSGQLGIEALSRGAASAVFTDMRREAVDVIRENLTSVGLAKNAQVVQTESLDYLRSSRSVFDIVFLDPPYDKGWPQKIFPLLTPHLSRYAIVVCEHSKREELPPTLGELEERRDYRYGATLVTIYRGGMKE